MIIDHILLTGTVQGFIELDGDVVVDGFEFGLEGRVAGGHGHAVGATAGFEGVVVEVLELGDAGLAPGEGEDRLAGGFLGKDVEAEGGMKRKIAGLLEMVKRGVVGLPVAFAAAFLLRFGGVGAGEASLAEVAREVLFGDCGAIGETDVVTVVALVCTSHC